MISIIHERFEKNANMLKKKKVNRYITDDLEFFLMILMKNNYSFNESKTEFCNRSVSSFRLVQVILDF